MARGTKSKKGTRVIKLEGTHLEDTVEMLNSTKEGVKFISVMGSSVEAMPLLAHESPLALGATFLSFAGRMQRMVDIENNTETKAQVIEVPDPYSFRRTKTKTVKTRRGLYERIVRLSGDLEITVRGWWYCKSITTGDACYRHPSGKGIISLDDAFAREMTPESTLVNGALDARDLYDEVDGIPVTKAQIEKYAPEGPPKKGKSRRPKFQTKKQARNNLLLRILARNPGDVPQELAIPGLLDEYLDIVYSGESWYGEPKIIPIYFAPVQTVPTMRLWQSIGSSNTFHDAVANGSLELREYTRMVAVLDKG